MERTLVASATNILVSGYMVVPTDRQSPSGEPVNALFAVVRAIHRVLEFKLPARAVAVIGNNVDTSKWPPLLQQQLPALPGLLRDIGIHVASAADEHHVVGSYVQAARDAGDDVIVVGRDKRFAQLVSDHVWWYDSNKDVRYTPDIVHKRFTVGPSVVAEWLALVGDQEALPGVKGIGAKGATTILETYGSLDAAMARLDTLDGRIGKSPARRERRRAARAGARATRSESRVARAARRARVQAPLGLHAQCRVRAAWFRRAPRRR